MTRPPQNRACLFPGTTAQASPKASQNPLFVAVISRMKLLMAFGMNESLFHSVEPVDPLAWAFRLILRTSDECLTAEWTETFLAGCQSKTAPVHRRRWRVLRR